MSDEKRYTFKHYPIIKVNKSNDVLQATIINSNIDRLVDLSTNCHPAMVENKEQLEKFRAKRYESIKQITPFVKCFFVWADEKIVGYCYVYSFFVLISIEKIDTYQLTTIDEKLYGEPISVYISDLCKDMDYKNVGSFLLDSIHDYYKMINKYNINHGVPLIEKMYLCPESSIYKNNYEAYVNDKEILIDNKKYYDSNMKLIKYYEKQQFIVEKYMYCLTRCRHMEDNDTCGIYMNVMSRKIEE